MVLKVIKLGEDRLNRFLRYCAKTVREAFWPSNPNRVIEGISHRAECDSQ